MTRHDRLLAVAAPGELGNAVRSVAATFASVLHATVSECPADSSLLMEGSDEARHSILRAATADDVVGVVVAMPAGSDSHVAMRFAAALDRPIVFVPSSVTAPFELRRVLIPLDGTRQATEAVAEAARIVRETGVDVVVLHCLHERSVPRFDDSPQYDAGDWAREFTARFREAFGLARLEVREGPAADHAIEVCGALGVNLVVLGWSRRPAPGRARTVRSMLERSTVPVLLLAA
jgi:nucleotide-binding universal stress UspA family protein